jgi:Rrf2 family iron-sulfur cluster assembly transcriptional regulator
MERLAVAAKGRPGSVRNPDALSAETGMAVPTITQVVTFLRRAGLVAQRGRLGGISLARPASQVTLYDVVRATDGTGLFRHCLMGLAECSDATPCPVHPFWKQARAVLEQRLQAQSVAELAGAMARKRHARRRIRHEGA